MNFFLPHFWISLKVFFEIWKIWKQAISRSCIPPLEGAMSLANLLVLTRWWSWKVVKLPGLYLCINNDLAIKIWDSFADACKVFLVLLDLPDSSEGNADSSEINTWDRVYLTAFIWRGPRMHLKIKIKILNGFIWLNKISALASVQGSLMSQKLQSCYRDSQQYHYPLWQF